MEIEAISIFYFAKFSEETHKIEKKMDCILEPGNLIKLSPSRFSRVFHNHAHKVGNVGIIANFVLPYSCSLLLFWEIMMLVNVKFNTSRY